MSLTTFSGPVKSLAGFIDGSNPGRALVTQDALSGAINGADGNPIGWLVPPGFVREADWRSLDIQTTSGLGVMTDATFGPAAVSNTGILSVDAAGIVTALKAGPLVIHLTARAQRTVGTGTAQVVVWSESRLNAASPWVQVGASGSSALPNLGERYLFSDFTLVNVVAGQQLRLRWARDPSGNNDGQLQPFVPTGTLAGLNVVPSAAFVAFRLNNAVYV